MNRRRLTVLVIAALLVIGIASYLSQRRNASHDTHDAPLFPALAGELASVSSLDIRKGSKTPTVSLRKKGEQWTVAQRADYPADVSKLRKLLLSLSDAKIIEEKTSEPANFAVIGVDDPASPTTLGTEIVFAVKDGSHTVIVGKPSGEGNFVRRGGEKTSYLETPGIYIESEPRFWIDTKLLDIPADNIDRIDYKPVAGAPYSVHRVVAPHAAPAPAGAAAAASAAAQPGAATQPSAAAQPSPPETGKDFALEGTPPGRKPADSPTLAPSPAVYGSLTADDVAPATEIDFSKPASTIVTMKDGSTVTLTGTVVGDKHWIQVNAPKDAALMARTTGRAFQIAGYRYDGLFRPLDQLLVPKEAPPDTKAPKPQQPKQPQLKHPQPPPDKQPVQP